MEGTKSSCGGPASEEEERKRQAAEWKEAGLVYYMQSVTNSAGSGDIPGNRGPGLRCPGALVPWCPGGHGGKGMLGGGMSSYPQESSRVCSSANADILAAGDAQERYGGKGLLGGGMSSYPQESSHICSSANPGILAAGDAQER
jgi:hypothetical protein